MGSKQYNFLKFSILFQHFFGEICGIVVFKIDRRTLDISRRPIGYTVLSVIISVGIFSLNVIFLETFTVGERSLAANVAYFNHYLFTFFILGGCFVAIFSRQTIKMYKIFQTLALQIKNLDESRFVYFDLLKSNFFLFAIMTLSGFCGTSGFIWFRYKSQPFHKKIMTFSAIFLGTTLNFNRLSVCHGFILVVRHFCRFLTILIENFCLRVQETETINEQLRMASLIHEIDVIYMDITNLLKLGKLYFEVPMLHLLFFAS